MYKWLTEGGRTPVRRVLWPVTIGDWTPPVSDPRIGGAGWHLMDSSGIAHNVWDDAPCLWEAVGRGRHAQDLFGDHVYESVSLIRPIGRITPDMLDALRYDFVHHARAATPSYVDGESLADRLWRTAVWSVFQRPTRGERDAERRWQGERILELLRRECRITTRGTWSGWTAGIVWPT